MKAIVLGSGIASGLPSWNDGSEIALRARALETDVPRRRGAMLAVTADRLRYSLLEAPFHLPATLALESRFAPSAGSRAVPIDAIVLTSAELDACAGALAVRSGLAARVVSSLGVRDALVDHDAAFVTLESTWTGLPWDRPFPLDRDGHLEARLFPLPGPTPDHLRDRSTSAGRGRAGVRITDRRSGRRLVWAPRIERYDSATLAELREADVRLVDGTCHTEDEGRRLRPGIRSSVELGHAPIDGRRGSLVQLAGMQGRSIYVHVAATNPIADAASKELARVREAGVDVAVDGLEIEP